MPLMYSPSAHAAVPEGCLCEQGLPPGSSGTEVIALMNFIEASLTYPTSLPSCTFPPPSPQSKHSPIPSPATTFCDAGSAQPQRLACFHCSEGLSRPSFASAVQRGVSPAQKGAQHPGHHLPDAIMCAPSHAATLTDVPLGESTYPIPCAAGS